MEARLTIPTPSDTGLKSSYTETSTMWYRFYDEILGLDKPTYQSGFPKIRGRRKTNEYHARLAITLSATGQPWIVTTSYDLVTSPGITRTTYILPVVCSSGWLTNFLAKMGFRIPGSSRFSFLTYICSPRTHGDFSEHND
jgi:hypothetical protein